MLRDIGVSAFVGKIFEHPSDDRVSARANPIGFAGRVHVLRIVCAYWFNLKAVLSTPDQQP